MNDCVSIFISICIKKKLHNTKKTVNMWLLFHVDHQSTADLDKEMRDYQMEFLRSFIAILMYFHVECVIMFI